jgi:hypothetical protein
MSTKPPPREQEQTIRTRKQFLFDAEELPVSGDPSKPRKSFAEYLRETPATPLNGITKAAVWGAGALVVLLLILTVMKTSGGGKPKPAAPQNGSISHPAPAQGFA